MTMCMHYIYIAFPYFDLHISFILRLCLKMNKIINFCMQCRVPMFRALSVKVNTLFIMFRVILCLGCESLSWIL